MQKEDLDLPNHLSGVRRKYLQLFFHNTSDLMTVRKVLLPVAIRNGEGYKDGVMMAQDEDQERLSSIPGSKKSEHSALSHIVGLREYDIPYHLRVGIDLDIQVGLWYNVSVMSTTTTIRLVDPQPVRPDLVVLAFDIETSKMPLKFPVASQDHIMMISYMINGRGFLIVNRDIVSQDIEDFEYTPKPDFPGVFQIENVPDEPALLNAFFRHIRQVQPQIFVTYNGDYFDWPFIETRAKIHNIDMADAIGISRNSQDEYGGTYCVHMDCFCWVKRDSYLPAGSHGLKAVSSIKLGYDPLELDPELMTPLASSDPQTLANYSVSDAVATYYLYMKYIHPFIFSLCNIIPLTPDEVLRKGTGTLCETLLMAQAYRANVIMPNKHEEPRERFYKGHLLDSETYIGGHVEALEAGVYRSDFEYKFKINPETIHQLIRDLDRALQFYLNFEVKLTLADKVTNYEVVKGEIVDMLLKLAETPIKHDRPLIYHLDVGSMYPNIILTNRLQPSAIVTDATCAVCDFNRPGKQCQRTMNWSWRGEFFSAKQNEYKMIKKQLESERFPARRVATTEHNTAGKTSATVAFHELSQVEQNALLKKRLADYSQKVYKKTRQNEVISKTSTVCQRENAFYINTVRAFRDRRYKYKDSQKDAKKKFDSAVSLKDPAKIEEASKLIVLYESLQLAHKCILNSFYGYVMRKAARWFSMEMAGIVCETGAEIIKLARQLIEQFGRPLELDTDGIWCMLPAGFPQNFTFELANGKKIGFAYPCVMLNHLIFDKFTNQQYQTLQPDGNYAVSSEMSIFFEIDGPYKAMVLPSSTEEGRQLKKRYAVFNEDGSLAELKGFEIKRRGELRLIKNFQSQIFRQYLLGSNLTECYKEVAEVANYWLDVLYSRGATLEDSELIELISENRSMSKSLEEYGVQKSTSISTAKRLAEFLGDQMVKDKGLACKFIISAKPAGLPVTMRAIPVAIFSAAPEIRRHFLSKWLRDPALSIADIRDIIDWEYYLERIGSMIQKLIVIPAATQQVSNPVPRVIPPEWLKRDAGSKPARMEQRKLTDMFAKLERPAGMVAVADVEDFHSRKAYKRPIEAIEPVTEEYPALPNIDPQVDYSAWVASRKAHWRMLSKRVRTRSPTDKRSNTLSSIFQDRVNIAKTPWQIIAIEATSTLGEFRIWALVGSTLRNFRIVIPRRIFVSMTVENPVGTRVHHRLPDGRPAPHLYEIVMPEKAFREEFIPRSAELLDPQLDGIWEAGLPLNFHMLVKMGAVVSMHSSGMRETGDRIYSTDELTFQSTSEIGYLTNNVQYVFHASLRADNRHVMLLAWSGRPTVRILVVDDGMRRQLPPAALKKMLSEVLVKDGIAATEPFVLTEDLMFEVDYFADIEAAHRSLYKELNVYLDNRPLPTIMISLNPAGEAFTRLPVVAMQPFLGYMPFPPLDWQRTVAKRLLEYHVQINAWLGAKLDWARFAHLPLASIPDDPLTLVADVFMARIHRQQGYLLPWNNTDGLDVTEKEFALASTVSSRHVDTSGLYRHVTVDFEVGSMAVNAILEYAHINQEGESIPPMFSLLKTLLANWLRETLNGHGNPLASELVSGVFRWIRSGQSRILPVSILQRLRLMMERAQVRLHAYLRHLGCTVVHGDHHRLVLATAKDHVDNACAFVEYIVKELRQTDGLAWIGLKPTQYWQTLLWMDVSNYSGFIVREVGNEEHDKANAESETIYQDLNLATFLPDVLAGTFNNLVAEYVGQARRVSETLAVTEARGIEREENALEVADLFIEAEDEQADYDDGSSIISEPFRVKLLAVISEMVRRWCHYDEARRKFPTRAGSHLVLTDGPVTFTKFLGAFLGLDKRAAPAIFKLIKQAYTLIGVREFSEETVFVDPCRSFILHDVVCAGCNTTRDLDFCRDAHLLSCMAQRKPLLCRVCRTAYDVAALEAEIIAELCADLANYQQQDLICKRCKSVKADQMGVLCSCAGQYRLEDDTSLAEKVVVIGRLARSFNLDALRLFISSSFQRDI